MSKLRFFQAGFIGLIAIISYLAFRDNYNDLPEVISISDVINHFMAFLVLSLFLDKGFSPKIWIGMLILLGYGVFIESVQYFLPNRAFELMDVVVDMSGVVFYYIAINILILRYKKGL